MDMRTNIENKEPLSRAERIEQIWWAAAALSEEHQEVLVRAAVALVVGQHRAHHLPEGRAVVHLAQVGQFVGDHVVDHRQREVDQPPVQPHRAVGGAVAAIGLVVRRLVHRQVDAVRREVAMHRREDREHQQVARLVGLQPLAEDAVFSMPPWALWWRGRETIAGFAPEGAVPLAFHVDYWNHLGWRDRFARVAGDPLVPRADRASRLLLRRRRLRKRRC